MLKFLKSQENQVVTAKEMSNQSGLLRIVLRVTRTINQMLLTRLASVVVIHTLTVLTGHAPQETKTATDAGVKATLLFVVHKTKADVPKTCLPQSQNLTSHQTVKII